jgi:hypothetical protein
MSPEARLFLLITPPSIPFGPIETTFTVVGNTDQTHHVVEVKFFSAKELKQKLETAGLPEFEIARAIERIRSGKAIVEGVEAAGLATLRLRRRKRWA